jgi:hypothetical protein
MRYLTQGRRGSASPAGFRPRRADYPRRGRNDRHYSFSFNPVVTTSLKCGLRQGHDIGRSRVFPSRCLGMGEGLAHDRLLEMLALVGVARDADVFGRRNRRWSRGDGACAFVGTTATKDIVPKMAIILRMAEAQRTIACPRGSRNSDDETVTLLDSHWKAGSPIPIG